MLLAVFCSNASISSCHIIMFRAGGWQSGICASVTQLVTGLAELFEHLKSTEGFGF
jgi:hypothetical protein